MTDFWRFHDEHNLQEDHNLNTSNHLSADYPSMYTQSRNDCGTRDNIKREYREYRYGPNGNNVNGHQLSSPIDPSDKEAKTVLNQNDIIVDPDLNPYCRIPETRELKSEREVEGRRVRMVSPIPGSPEEGDLGAGGVKDPVPRNYCVNNSSTVDGEGNSTGNGSGTAGNAASAQRNERWQQRREEYFQKAAASSNNQYNQNDEHDSEVQRHNSNGNIINSTTGQSLVPHPPPSHQHPPVPSAPNMPKNAIRRGRAVRQDWSNPERRKDYAQHTIEVNHRLEQERNDKRSSSDVSGINYSSSRKRGGNYKNIASGSSNINHISSPNDKFQFDNNGYSIQQQDYQGPLSQSLEDKTRQFTEEKGCYPRYDGLRTHHEKRDVRKREQEGVLVKDLLKHNFENWGSYVEGKEAENNKSKTQQSNSQDPIHLSPAGIPTTENHTTDPKAPKLDPFKHQQYIAASTSKVGYSPVYGDASQNYTSQLGISGLGGMGTEGCARHRDNVQQVREYYYGSASEGGNLGDQGNGNGLGIDGRSGKRRSFIQKGKRIVNGNINYKKAHNCQIEAEAAAENNINKDPYDFDSPKDDDTDRNPNYGWSAPKDTRNKSLFDEKQREENWRLMNNESQANLYGSGGGSIDIEKSMAQQLQYDRPPPHPKDQTSQQYSDELKDQLNFQKPIARAYREESQMDQKTRNLGYKKAVEMKNRREPETNAYVAQHRKEVPWQSDLSKQYDHPLGINPNHRYGAETADGQFQNEKMYQLGEVGQIKQQRYLAERHDDFRQRSRTLEREKDRLIHIQQERAKSQEQQYQKSPSYSNQCYVSTTDNLNVQYQEKQKRLKSEQEEEMKNFLEKDKQRYPPNQLRGRNGNTGTRLEKNPKNQAISRSLDWTDCSVSPGPGEHREGLVNINSEQFKVQETDQERRTREAQEMLMKNKENDNGRDLFSGMQGQKEWKPSRNMDVFSSPRKIQSDIVKEFSGDNINIPNQQRKFLHQHRDKHDPDTITRSHNCPDPDQFDQRNNSTECAQYQASVPWITKNDHEIRHDKIREDTKSTYNKYLKDQGIDYETEKHSGPNAPFLFYEKESDDGEPTSPHPYAAGKYGEGSLTRNPHQRSWSPRANTKKGNGQDLDQVLSMDQIGVAGRDIDRQKKMKLQERKNYLVQEQNQHPNYSRTPKRGKKNLHGFAAEILQKEEMQISVGERLGDERKKHGLNQSHNDSSIVAGKSSGCGYSSTVNNLNLNNVQKLPAAGGPPSSRKVDELYNGHWFKRGQTQIVNFEENVNNLNASNIVQQSRKNQNAVVNKTGSPDRSFSTQVIDKQEEYYNQKAKCSKNGSSSKFAKIGDDTSKLHQQVGLEGEKIEELYIKHQYEEYNSKFGPEIAGKTKYIDKDREQEKLTNPNIVGPNKLENELGVEGKHREQQAKDLRQEVDKEQKNRIMDKIARENEKPGKRGYGSKASAVGDQPNIKDTGNYTEEYVNFNNKNVRNELDHLGEKHELKMKEEREKVTKLRQEEMRKNKEDYEREKKEREENYMKKLRELECDEKSQKNTVKSIEDFTDIVYEEKANRIREEQNQNLKQGLEKMRKDTAIGEKARNRREEGYKLNQDYGRNSVLSKMQDSNDKNAENFHNQGKAAWLEYLSKQKDEQRNKREKDNRDYWNDRCESDINNEVSGSRSYQNIKSKINDRNPASERNLNILHNAQDKSIGTENPPSRFQIPVNGLNPKHLGLSTVTEQGLLDREAVSHLKNQQVNKQVMLYYQENSTGTKNGPESDMEMAQNVINGTSGKNNISINPSSTVVTSRPQSPRIQLLKTKEKNSIPRNHKISDDTWIADPLVQQAKYFDNIEGLTETPLFEGREEQMRRFDEEQKSARRVHEREKLKLHEQKMSSKEEKSITAKRLGQESKRELEKEKQEWRDKINGPNGQYMHSQEETEKIVNKLLNITTSNENSISDPNKPQTNINHVLKKSEDCDITLLGQQTERLRAEKAVKDRENLSKELQRLKERRDLENPDIINDGENELLRKNGVLTGGIRGKCHDLRGGAYYRSVNQQGLSLNSKQNCNLNSNEIDSTVMANMKGKSGGLEGIVSSNKESASAVQRRVFETRTSQDMFVTPDGGPNKTIQINKEQSIIGLHALDLRTPRLQPNPSGPHFRSDNIFLHSTAPKNIADSIVYDSEKREREWKDNIRNESKIINNQNKNWHRSRRESDVKNRVRGEVIMDRLNLQNLNNNLNNNVNSFSLGNNIIGNNSSSTINNQSIPSNIINNSYGPNNTSFSTRNGPNGTGINGQRSGPQTGHHNHLSHRAYFCHGSNAKNNDDWQVRGKNTHLDMTPKKMIKGPNENNKDSTPGPTVTTDLLPGHNSSQPTTCQNLLQRNGKAIVTASLSNFGCISTGVEINDAMATKAEQGGNAKNSNVQDPMPSSRTGSKMRNLRSAIVQIEDGITEGPGLSSDSGPSNTNQEPFTANQIFKVPLNDGHTFSRGRGTKSINKRETDIVTGLKARSEMKKLDCGHGATGWSRDYFESVRQSTHNEKYKDRKYP